MGLLTDLLGDANATSDATSLIGLATATTSQEGISAYTEIAGLALSGVSLATAGKLRVTHLASRINGTNVGDLARIRIDYSVDGGAWVVGNSVIAPITNASASPAPPVVFETSAVMAAGTYAFRVMMRRESGTGTVGHVAKSDEIAQLRAERVGS